MSTCSSTYMKLLTKWSNFPWAFKNDLIASASLTLNAVPDTTLPGTSSLSEATAASTRAWDEDEMATEAPLASAAAATDLPIPNNNHQSD